MRAATRLRLLAFLVIGAVAVVHAGVRYAGLDSLVRSDTYTVTVHLAESGGIFERAEVTFRGVTVGRIKEVNFRRDGVTAVLQIDDDRQIPADLKAEVHNRSAVGEQYIDLLPRRDGVPYLRAGSVVDVGNTSTPIDEDELLGSLDAFVRSVDPVDLSTVVDELGLAFEGAGSDVQRLIDGGSTIIEAAHEALPATQALVRDAGTVLETQDDQAQLIASYLGDLSTVTGIVSDQDGDVRLILKDGARATKQLRLLTKGLSPSLAPLLANVKDLSNIAYQRQGEIEETLVAVPWALASAQTPGRDEKAHFVLSLAQSPDVCREGYLSAGQWRLPQDTSVVPVTDDIGCTEGAPTLPRGVPRTLEKASPLNRVAAVGYSTPPEGWTPLFMLPLLAD